MALMVLTRYNESQRLEDMWGVLLLRSSTQRDNFALEEALVSGRDKPPVRV